MALANQGSCCRSANTGPSHAGGRRTKRFDDLPAMRPSGFAPRSINHVYNMQTTSHHEWVLLAKDKAVFEDKGTKCGRPFSLIS
eukprot:scaffold8374_cov29-Prasinocladus_malaysianus.AAC.2